MLTKLRKKFILINMVCVISILVAVFLSVIFTYYRMLNNDVNMSLKQVTFGNFEKKKPFEPEPHGEERPMIKESDFLRVVPAFSVTIDKDGEIQDVLHNRMYTTEEQLVEAIKHVLSGEKDSGMWEDWKYVIDRKPSGDVVAFADYKYVTNSMKNLVLISLIIGAAAISLFYLLSYFLSKLVLKPVETAWEQQRQFVSNASHELKTPITVILANLSILKSHQNSTIESEKKWINNTEDEANHMKELVEDLLFLAKSDTVKEHNFEEKVDLSSIVMGVVLQFEAVAFESMITLDSVVAENIKIKGDKKLLSGLVHILIDNACKYVNDKGSVTVKLKLTQSRPVLSVFNTGNPIPENDLPFIFNRFYRAEKSREKTKGGYGLGLAIAANIAEIHSAKITVESTSKGTIFKVNF